LKDVGASGSGGEVPLRQLLRRYWPSKQNMTFSDMTLPIALHREYVSLSGTEG
jgi:hypothetical protein